MCVCVCVFVVRGGRACAFVCVYVVRWRGGGGEYVGRGGGCLVQCPVYSNRFDYF